MTTHDAEQYALRALEKWERVQLRPAPRRDQIEAKAALLVAAKMVRESKGA